MTERPSAASALARADSAHQKIESHEELCAERYRAINDTLGELKSGATWQNRWLLGLLIALVGWMGVQLWNGRNDEIKAPVHASAGR
ncbi:hypothetical protein [Phenylobacterium sp. J367]|uniref:hypothetical protein n=1 Tax=Phenylobacterium sp. J367 TaxID=2898435 RepID=UPI002151D635|nr:hypothetical protein [Phenylobacterium sp. J367]MCR5876988.1 hypothetical protein [Phenylobacterium sp. J367]MCR5881186.1 hypothetical protein [Phenylobacterium sp. J367]